MDEPDAALLSRVARGDREAFAAFYDRHAPGVRGLLVRLVGGDADDALQETFWQAWRLAGRYDAGKAGARAWLLMLARSRALDLLRRRRPAPPAAPGEEPTVWPDLGGALERDEEGARLRTALEALPPEQRHALCLAFYDGLTHEQVAHAQGVPLGTAKTRIRLAMVRLRGLLGEAPEVTAR